MLFSGKENVFMCLVAFQKMFQKIFSNVWLCFWKYHRKHIFYLLLAFSHIFSVIKRIYNIIHSSKHKQNPEKNHQIQTLRVIAIGAKVRSQSARSALRVIAIDASHDRDCAKRRSAWCRWCRRTARCRWCRDLFFLSPFLSFSCSLSLFYFPRPEIIWSENGNGNDFPLFWLSFSVNWKCFSVWSNLK